jgi:integrase
MPTYEERGKYQIRAKIRIKGYPSLSKTFTSKKEAEAWAKLEESKMLRRTWVSISESEKTTVRDVLERYRIEVLPSKKSQHPVLYQIKSINRFLGAYSLASLTSSNVADFRDKRLKEVDPQTVIKDLSLLQRVLNLVMKEWGINLPHGNPVQQIKMPKQPEGRDRRPHDNEINLILWELRDNKIMYNIVLFAIETAMRRSEITSMNWKHIDLAKKVLLVPITKTNISRKIPLSSKAISILNSLPRVNKDSVWGIKADSITKAFNRACERANIEDLRFHDLRHEATSRFFEKSLSIMEVSTITGHKDLRMLKRYTHIRAEELANKLG